MPKPAGGTPQTLQSVATEQATWQPAPAPDDELLLLPVPLLPVPLLPVPLLPVPLLPVPLLPVPLLPLLLLPLLLLPLLLLPLPASLLGVPESSV
jgi:hypothetical protein